MTYTVYAVEGNGARQEVGTFTCQGEAYEYKVDMDRRCGALWFDSLHGVGTAERFIVKTNW